MTGPSHGGLPGPTSDSDSESESDGTGIMMGAGEPEHTLSPEVSSSAERSRSIQFVRNLSFSGARRAQEDTRLHRGKQRAAGPPIAADNPADHGCLQLRALPAAAWGRGGGGVDRRVGVWRKVTGNAIGICGYYVRRDRWEGRQSVPDERCLLTIHLTSLGALPGGRQSVR
jgi:hypothetical protein